MSVTAEQIITSGPPTVSYDDHKAILMFNRPHHHNRIEADDLIILQQQLTAIAQNPDVRVLILTATGPSFSSGYHIGDIEQKSTPDVEPSSAPTPFAQTADQLENLAIPTICAFNGSVYGGSTDIALACDFRIGIYGMKLRMPAARLGLQYYANGMRRYVERLGIAAAKKLFLTATTIDTEELLRIGYLDQAVAPEDLLNQAHGLADELAGNAPLAVCGMKHSLNQIARGCGDDTAMNLAHSQSVLTADAREGVLAWQERREPDFQGC